MGDGDARVGQGVDEGERTVEGIERVARIVSPVVDGVRVPSAQSQLTSSDPDVCTVEWVEGVLPVWVFEMRASGVCKIIARVGEFSEHRWIHVP